MFCPMKLKANILYTTMLAEPVFVFLLSVEEKRRFYLTSGGGGGTLGIFGWGRAAGTLEPLAYCRASSSEFCYPIILD